MTVRILKFSGSSLAGIDQIGAAAERVRAVCDMGIRAVAVVSALPGTTHRLISTARQLHPDPPGEELDRLLCTGEDQAAALLAIALGRVGVRARSLSGREAGIHTDENFGRARILNLESGAISATLEAGETPVVSGFQGATVDGRATTLGRGGTDITAVALGVHFGAERIVFYRDVDGVYSADPNVLPGCGQRLERLDYDSMIDLAEAGVPILHPQALELARAHQLELELRGWRQGGGSTLICEEPCPARLPVWSISLSRRISLLTIDPLPDDLGLLAQLVALLDRTDLPVDSEFHNSGRGMCLTVQAPDADGESLRHQVTDFLREETHIITSLERSRRRVTLVGRGVGSRRVSKAVEEIGNKLGPPLATFWGNHHRAFVVPDGEGRFWLSGLHQSLIKT